MPHPIHHKHKRKRIHIGHEKYPHPNKLKNFVDKLIYVVGVFVPAMSLIQVHKIYAEKTADGISMIAYCGFFAANLVWLLYGFLHKEKPIVLMYILLAVFNFAVIIGTIIY